MFDEHNLTTADEHMWLIPFTEGESHWLKVEFPQRTNVSGVRIWNYNKSPEDTFRGVSQKNIFSKHMTGVKVGKGTESRI